MKRKHIAVIVGTRPEVIKMAPVIFALRRSRYLQPMVISTGQHRQMLDQAMASFGITADIDLGLMRDAQTLPDLTARAIVAIADVLRHRRPSAVLLQGDTTSVLAGAIAAFYEGVPVGHVEAGLRTHDLFAPWPEELNRRLTDPVSKWCFVPTPRSAANLMEERISKKAIVITGNTVIDALFWMRARLRSQRLSDRSRALDCGIPEPFANHFFGDKRAHKVILVTGHRRESFGKPFEAICRALLAIVSAYPEVGLVYPVHLNPRVQTVVNRMLAGHPHIALIPPLAYEPFIWLMDKSHFVITDSGGVQEEAPSLGKPVLVTRSVTERPEGVAAGTCVLVGSSQRRILDEANRLLTDAREYRKRSRIKNPYGDGEAATRIVRCLERALRKS
jgi:UDP-N-acetylglucosamine 2-epimerase (non-hydrolysing)